MWEGRPLAALPRRAHALPVAVRALVLHLLRAGRDQVQVCALRRGVADGSRTVRAVLVVEDVRLLADRVPAGLGTGRAAVACIGPHRPRRPIDADVHVVVVTGEDT